MNLSSRLNKVETLIKAKHKKLGEIILFNEFVERIEGQIVKMPTPEAEGLARLPDGTEKAIVYYLDGLDQPSISLISEDGINIMSEAPGVESSWLPLKGKLFIRRENVSDIFIVSIRKVENR